MKQLYTILFILVFSGIQAQNNYFEEWYSAEKEDIPQNSIKSIAPDKHGFLWMSTENGLLRFDGRKFKVYNSSNTNVKSNRFAYISGNIENDSLTVHTAHHLDSFIINQRTIKKNNKADKNNIDKANKKNNFEEVLYYSNNVNDLGNTFENTAITCKNGDYYFIGSNKISFYNKSKKLLKEVKLDYQENTAYFLHQNELVLLNYKDNNYRFFQSNFAEIYQINIPKNAKLIYNYVVQQLFVFTDKEIFLVRKNSDTVFLQLIFSKSKINLNIKSLYFDKKNDKLFIGTIDKGLNVISLNNFHTLINPKSTNNNYYGIYPISENEFVTTKGEIYNAKGVVSAFNTQSSDHQQSITVDKQKNIWIPNGLILQKYLKATNYTKFISYSLDHKIAAVYCDSKNKIWIGMDRIAQKNAKVFTIDANDDNAKLELLPNISSAVKFFAEDSKNQIFIVCENQVIIYDLQTKNIKSIPAGINEIRSLFIASDESIWACTFNNGISLLENSKFYKMPDDFKMYLLAAHCIKEDNKGHFWISTNKGLVEVSLESLKNYHKNKTPVYYHHYNIKNGFLTNEFNGGCQPCAIEINDQYIFPSLNGLVSFNPDRARKISPLNDFYINEVELDGTSFHFNDIVHIKRKISRVKFKIDYAYFGNSDNIWFEVKLDLNGNEDWIKASNENDITYTNLPPGNHTFYVRRIKPFTSEYEIKKITVNIPFFFYEKIGFKFLVSLFLITILIFAVKMRYRFIRRKNIALEQTVKMRTADLFNTVSSLKIAKRNLDQEVLQQKKLIGTISHDIKSPLKFLSITAKHLYNKTLISENNNIQDNAKVMHESASQLFRFVENLVDYSKVFIEHNDIHKLRKENIDLVINEKINLFQNIAIDNGNEISYQNNSPEPIVLNNKVIGIMIHNLLDNAIKNTTNGIITIETNVVKDKIYISVEDSGTGMSEEIKEYYMNILNNYETDKLAIQNYGLGLHMVLELLRLLKGDLKIYSKENEGTRISIILDSN